MLTPKQSVGEILRELPDDVTYDDIIYRLYARSKIERAMEDIREGRVVDQEEAERLTAQWRTGAAAQ